ncbi:uracil-xanthine permease family protein [Kutzneria albida]|uniref:Uracil-xanthine permease n=1 Tax=Kutzneria albida DSM 43870 TaxID=1449976 RepID=W5WH28_9PSEU|nr:solute carrier family 23 protein [Kutzneria albida]AHI00509.1 hypothetical protein KALB_7151 [Kutzneria albida DSM 43870]
MALWTVHGDGRRVTDGEVVGPQERLSWPLTVGFGLQHIAAMFGATVLVPAYTGFPVTSTLLFSGLGTLLFLFLTRNRVPSYLGSSFAFVAPLAAARENGTAAQLGGVLAAGLMLVVVGVAVKALGVRLLESLMPPAVTGAVVMLIGLNLAPSAVRSVTPQPGIAAVTVGVVLVCGVLGRGLLSRASVLVGVIAGWLVAACTVGLEKARLDAVAEADWIGLPQLLSPELRPSVVLTVLPVVIVLVAENVGHVKAVAAVTGRNLDGSVGDALIANGLATVLAGSGGGSGTTTYAENIGVMTATKVYSTAAYVVAACGAVLLSFSPKFGALLSTMPAGVMGGASLLLYGLIVLVGVRIWTTNGVDLLNPVNLMVGGAALIAGAGDLSLRFGEVELGGIAWGSMFVVLVHPLLRAMYAARRN